MKIQGINNANNALSCQPIKQVEFAKTPVRIEKEEVAQNGDSFKTDRSTLEQKYDLACRLAAYYKTQYEKLLKSGSVVA